METSLAYIEAAEVLMSFPKFRIYFIVIYIYVYVCEEYVKIQSKQSL
jgi:hypothetical protein